MTDEEIQSVLLGLYVEIRRPLEQQMEELLETDSRSAEFIQAMMRNLCEAVWICRPDNDDYGLFSYRE